MFRPRSLSNRKSEQRYQWTRRDARTTQWKEAGRAEHFQRFLMLLQCELICTADPCLLWCKGVFSCSLWVGGSVSQGENKLRLGQLYNFLSIILFFTQSATVWEGCAYPWQKLNILLYITSIWWPFSCITQCFKVHWNVGSRWGFVY